MKVVSSKWLIVLAMICFSAGFIVACGDDDSCEEDEYFCTCTCYTPIGNVDRGHYVSACDEDEAYEKAQDAQADSPCDYSWTCGSCDKT